MLKKNGLFITVWVVVLLIGLLMIILSPNGIWGSIGTSLIAAGIVAAAMLWHDYVKAPTDELHQEINKSGLKGFYNRRNLDKYNELVTDCREIDIAGYSLRSFHESNKKLLLDKIKNGRMDKIRIILTNPESEFAKAQEETEGVAEGTFLKALETLNSSFKGIGEIEIRILNRPVSTMIYRLDDTLFYGPYLSAYSTSTVTYECQRNGWMFNVYQDEFDRMWEDAAEL
ncbi:hypothetical protein [Terasakiella pusilla]|uniref:hypothetical protein n=1 Tax=Terasakiella pusilla TaxID=64973 RepID=UPI003AA9A61F